MARDWRASFGVDHEKAGSGFTESAFSFVPDLF